MRLFRAIRLAMHYMRTGEVSRDFQTPVVSASVKVTVLRVPDDVREILFSRRSSALVTVADDRTYYVDSPNSDVAALHINVMLNLMRLCNNEPPWFRYLGKDSSGDKDIFVLTPVGIEATDNYRREHGIS